MYSVQVSHWSIDSRQPSLVSVPVLSTVMEFLCTYEVREILAMGMFSEVKRCIDKRTKEAYAVKIVPYHSENQKKRIEDEIQVSETYNCFTEVLKNSKITEDLR